MHKASVWPILLFILIISGIFLFLGYADSVFLLPQSIHKWRQADCASLALNYYQHGMHFFQPEVHNLTSDHGTTGYSCPGEIPLLYYIVAILYQLFGYHDLIFRLFNLVLFSLGLVSLYGIFRLRIHSIFWSVVLPLLFLTSPVLDYYGNNYLSDVPALALVWTGWYFFFSYLENRRIACFWGSMLFMLLGASCKITALLSPIALMSVWMLEQLQKKPDSGNTKVFVKPGKQLAAMFSILLLMVLWVLFARWYNNQHQSTYFSTMIRPVWLYKGGQRAEILDAVIHGWGSQYFHPSVYLFWIVCILVLLKFRRSASRLLLQLSSLLFLGVLSFFFLEFWFFKDHDYYMINLMVWPFILMLAATEALQSGFPRILQAWWLRIPFLIFLIFNLWYAREKVLARYDPAFSGVKAREDYYSIRPFLRQMGIQPNDRIISLPEGNHSSLYLANQPGWTGYYERGSEAVPEYRYNRDSAGIQWSIDKGAKYLLIYGAEVLNSQPFLHSFARDLVGQYKNILVFRLPPMVDNFRVNPLLVREEVYCNAENRSSDGQYYTDSAGAFQLGDASALTDSIYRSENHAVKLDGNHPFAMTMHIGNAGRLEHFNVMVWISGPGKRQTSIIASGDTADFYYDSESVLSFPDSSWSLLSKDFVIPEKMSHHALRVYLYHAGSEQVYADDFRLKRYTEPFSRLEQNGWKPF